MSTLKSPIVAAIASAALTAGVVGGVAIAQTSTPTVVTACVAEGSGNVRIVSSASDCRSNETTTSWNQQGPQGLQGPQGPQGAEGPTGATGPAGTARAWGEWSDFHDALINGPAPGVTVERVQTGSYCVKVDGVNLLFGHGIVATLHGGASRAGYGIGWNRGSGRCTYGAIDVYVSDAAGQDADASFFFMVP